MGGTTPRGIPYPADTDPPAGHTQMRAMAEAVDPLLQTLCEIHQSEDDVTPIPGKAIVYFLDEGDAYQPMFKLPDGLNVPFGDPITK